MYLSFAGHDGRRKRPHPSPHNPRSYAVDDRFWLSKFIRALHPAGHDGRRKRPHPSPHNPRPYAEKLLLPEFATY